MKTDNIFQISRTPMATKLEKLYTLYTQHQQQLEHYEKELENKEILYKTLENKGPKISWWNEFIILDGKKKEKLKELNTSMDNINSYDETIAELKEEMEKEKTQLYHRIGLDLTNHNEVLKHQFETITKLDTHTNHTLELYASIEALKATIKKDKQLERADLFKKTLTNNKNIQFLIKVASHAEGVKTVNSNEALIDLLKIMEKEKDELIDLLVKNFGDGAEEKNTIHITRNQLNHLKNVNLLETGTDLFQEAFDIPFLSLRKIFKLNNNKNQINKFEKDLDSYISSLGEIYEKITSRQEGLLEDSLQDRASRNAL